jgi:putative membrane protein
VGVGFILWLVILAVIIASVVWFVRSQLLAGSQRSLERHSPALEALEERYARGEINREEYLQKKRDITD